MLKAVIFDMDGVLIDSEPIHFETDVNVLKKMGIDLSFDFYKQFIGTPMRNIWTRIREKYNISLSVDELIDLSEIEKKRIIEETGYREIKGVANLVKDISDNGYLLAVASSSPYDYIQTVTKAININQYFVEILSGEHFENPKPAPDIFIEAAKRLGVNPDECLVIEDSKNGVTAAKAAEMVCLGFVNPSSGDQDISAADYLTEGFEEVDSNFLEMVYCHSLGEPWKVMETKRLLIREISVDDLDNLYKIYEDESVTRFTEPLYERPEEEYFTKAYIKNMYRFYGYGLWVVILKETGELIGRAGLSNRNINGENEVEIGYLFGEKYQKKGYAYESCTAIIDFAKYKLELNKLNCFTDSRNTRAINLAKKLGFKHVGFSKSKNMEYKHFELTL